MTEHSQPRLTPLELAECARRLAASPAVDHVMEHIVQLALDSLGCEYASVTLVHADGTLETVASSHPVVDQADALQYSLGEGPCVTAAKTDGLYLSPETASDSRWPNWGPRAAELGLHSIMSVHLFTERQVLGALNLYARASRRYTDTDVETARVVAAHASVGLARSRAEQNLWRAIDSRHLIGQAQGVLMERFGFGTEQAFSVLKRYSQEQNLKLREVASTLLRTGVLPGTEQDSQSGFASPA